MYSKNIDKAGPLDWNRLPPLPTQTLPKGHTDMSEGSNSESLIDHPVTDPIHNQADTARNAGGNSSLPLPFGTGDGLKLPPKAGVVQRSSVSTKERSWNIECVAMRDGILDGIGKCMEKVLMYGCAGLLRECRKFPSDSVGELALQGVRKPVYRFEDQFCDTKGCPNTIETPDSIYAYQKTRCELQEKKVHRRGCIEVLQEASRSCCKNWQAWCRGHESELPEEVDISSRCPYIWSNNSVQYIPTVHQVREMV